jgi:hypothetical protein
MGAERAYLFLVSDDEKKELLWKPGRNSEKEDLVEPKKFSARVVARVGQQRRAVLRGPLLSGDKLIGGVYLDNRLAKAVFSAKDLVK